MAGTLADVWVSVRGKVDELKKDVDKGGKEAGARAGKSFGLSFGSIIKGVGTLFASAAVVDFLKSSIEEARESVRVSNLTAAAIRSTGGAARITAAQVGDLATALSNKTGVDDEAIQSGENLILTFTNIRNAAGRGNDIFNQTSAAVLDMTAAMNAGEISADGIKTSSIQLGKALNDPIKGVTALTKVGVTFTQGQKDQIKNLVAHNNLIGAQKIILAEVNKEFGGAAAAATDPAQKAIVAWGNFKEFLGGLFLTLLGKVAGVLTGVLTVAMGLVNRAMTALGPVIKVVVDAIRPLAEKYGPIVGQVLSLLGGVIAWLVPQVWKFVVGVATLASKFSADFMPVIKAVVGVLGGALVVAVKSVVEGIASFVTWLNGASKPAGFLKTVIEGIVAGLIIYATYLAIVRTATIIWAAVQWLLNVALTANPIGLIIVGIAALVAAIIWVATKTQFFQTVWGAIWSFLKTVGAWFAGPFAGFFVGLWNKLDGLFRAGAAIVISVAAAIHARWSAIINFFSAIPGNIARIFNLVKTSITTAMTNAANAAKTAASNLVNGVIGFFSGLPGRARGEFNKIKDAAVGALSAAGSWLIHAGENIIQGLINGIKNGAGRVKDAVAGVLKQARDLLPFSPAKEGPFSGKGWTFYSGQSMVKGLADGLKSMTPQLHAQMTATLGGRAGGTAVGGTTTNTTHFAPTYNVAGAVDEQALAKATVSRLLFALGTGSG